MQALVDSLARVIAQLRTPPDEIELPGRWGLREGTTCLRGAATWGLARHGARLDRTRRRRSGRGARLDCDLARIGCWLAATAAVVLSFRRSLWRTRPTRSRKLVIPLTGATCPSATLGCCARRSPTPLRGVSGNAHVDLAPNTTYTVTHGAEPTLGTKTSTATVTLNGGVGTTIDLAGNGDHGFLYAEQATVIEQLAITGAVAPEQDVIEASPGSSASAPLALENVNLPTTRRGMRSTRSQGQRPERHIHRRHRHVGAIYISSYGDAKPSVSMTSLSFAG